MTTRTRANFDNYIICHFDHENPTKYGEREAVTSLEHRLRLYGKVRMTVLAQHNPRMIYLLHMHPPKIPNLVVTRDA